MPNSDYAAEQGTHRRFAVVGTAGHVDHGKTALVEALTGKNTDRLKEEQERGISIDIDFAPLSYEDGTLIGLVDVPGHERFVHNMVAGAVGVDAAILVIDAGEGLKPQTYEHIAILDVLGVRKVLVALTKIDAVTEEWLEVVEELVLEALDSTPYADATILRTSAKTGQGVAALKQALLELVESLPDRDTYGAFRLPVDKTYSIPGHGTVVSGTVWRGRVSVGDTLELLPGRRTVRVRSIQVHGHAVDNAVAGQRAALNLTGVSKADVHRGMVVCGQGTLFETKLMDVEVSVVASAERSLRHRDRVHVHLGTGTAVGRVLLLDTDEVFPGDSGFAQILLEQPLVCEARDSFVLRTFSPVTTIGGGLVIDATPSRLHRRKKASILEDINKKRSSSPIERILKMADSGRAVTMEAIVSAFGCTREEAEAWIREAEHKKLLVELPSGWHARQGIDRMLSALEESLYRLHRKHRFANWLQRSLLRAEFPTVDARDMAWLLEAGASRGWWVLRQASMRAADWEVQFSAEEEMMLQSMLDMIRSAGCGGVNPAKLVQAFPKRDRVAAALLSYAVSEGLVVMMNAECVIHTDVLNQAMDTARELYQQSGSFSLGAFRDALGTGRNAAVSVLEYFDKVKWTERRGDVRVVLQRTGGAAADGESEVM